MGACNEIGNLATEEALKQGEKPDKVWRRENDSSSER